MGHDTGRHELPPTRSRAASVAMVVAATLVVVVAGATGGIIVANRGDRPPPAAARADVTPSTSAPSTTTESDEQLAAERLASAVADCRIGNLRQQAALSRAAVSLAMWDKHIEAMNLLVAGKITWAVAVAFWDSSRVGAVKAVADFDASDRGYTALDAPACAALDDPLATGSDATATTNALARCGAALGKGDAVLRVARPAVRTWEHHIHDMEALREGRITPAQATAKWRRDWKAGNAQLQRYRATVAALGAQPCALD